jgi:hypothetical protein
MAKSKLLSENFEGMLQLTESQLAKVELPPDPSIDYGPY